MITIEQARERILTAVEALPEEELPVAEALDRVLARDVRAAHDVPPFACSAMDGYAVVHGDAGRELRVAGESRAGAPAREQVTPATAVRISTGAAIPSGADAVVRQEDVEAEGETIRLAAVVEPRANIRGAGEDMCAGTTVLRAGTTLRAPQLGAAVAAGAGALRVSAQPRATVICTGDELRAPGEPLDPGQIHNTNGPMLLALARRAGALASGPILLRDDPGETESVLSDALASCDVMIVSGGVSVGPHDLVKPALVKLGVEERFWGVALQPGKPTWFGTRGRQLVFGLPGNPVSAFVTFALFVWPALATLQGATEQPRLPARARLGAPVRQNPGREQALRVRLDYGGGPVATPNGPQGSHVLSSLLGAHALALIPRGEGELRAGAEVALAPLPT